MRYSRVLQCIYKAKKRPIWYFRHIGYWARRDNCNPTHLKIQYVYKNKKNKRITYVARNHKVWLANLGDWVV